MTQAAPPLEPVTESGHCRLSEGALRLQLPNVFARPDAALCRGFLSRVLALDVIREIDLHPALGAAEIKFGNTQSPAEVLASLVRALRSEQQGESLAERLYLGRSRPVLRIFRYGGAVSTWEVLHQLPGRIRVRHEELLRRPAAARHVERELACTLGIETARASAATGSVLIHYCADRLRLTHLFQVLEGLLPLPTGIPYRGYEHQAGSATLTAGTLALAAAADFALPVLAPLSAGVLVATNLRTLAAAAGELRQARPSVNTLYATIVLATLASGSFFAAALMSSFMHYWDRQYHRRLAAAQQDLLAPLERAPAFVCLCRDADQAEIQLSHVRPGDELAIRAGESIPADGVVVDGTGIADERPLRGRGELCRKSAGDRVFAASILLEGQLRVQVGAMGERTLAASLGQTLLRATTPVQQPLKARGEPFARRLVPPTLATAGVGFLVGDLTTALAILRPDYASGPGMTAPLGTLEAISRCARAGLIVAEPWLFATLPRVTALAIDPTVAAEADAPEVAFVRSRCKLSIGLISDLPPQQARQLEGRLGLDFSWQASSPRQWTESFAVLGDCERLAAAAQAAEIAIHFGRDTAPPAMAQAGLLNSDWTHIAQLWEIAELQAQRNRVHGACTLVPNLCCVAGAFALGFTGLHAVLLTNLGTLTVYRSASRWLRERPRVGGATGRSPVPALMSSALSEAKL